MRNLIFLGFVILLGCSKASLKKDESANGLEALLSEEDLTIHRCLHSGKGRAQCLVGTPYESFTSRTPSSDDALIMKNNWFFDSKENIEEFYRVSRGFLKAQSKLLAKGAGKLVNKNGIAVEGSAFFGGGRGWLAEFAVHQNRLGFFCAPTYSLQSDIGIEGELAVSRSLSCIDNNAYAGEDISFTAGVSGELIGLPVGVGFGYSMSINPAAFRAKIAEARRKGFLNSASVRNELDQLIELDMKRSLSRSYRYGLPLMTFALRPLSLFNIKTPEMSSRQALHIFVRDMIRNDRSAGRLFKEFYSKQLRAKLVRHRLHNLNAYFAALDASITGCDAVGGSASLGLTVSPVTLGVVYAKTSLIAEVGAPELSTFSSMTPMALLNPFLLQPEDLKNVVRVARSFVSLPTKVKRQCLR